MDNPRARLLALIARKRSEDPEGFQKAEKNSDLLYYLSEDMRKLRIDASILTNHLRRINEQPPVISQVHQLLLLFLPYCNIISFNISFVFIFQDIDEYVDIAARYLDENMYEPYYQLSRGEGHMGMEIVLSWQNHSHL